MKALIIKIIAALALVGMAYSAQASTKNLLRCSFSNGGGSTFGTSGKSRLGWSLNTNKEGKLLFIGRGTSRVELAIEASVKGSLNESSTFRTLEIYAEEAATVSGSGGDYEIKAGDLMATLTQKAFGEPNLVVHSMAALKSVFYYYSVQYERGTNNCVPSLKDIDVLF